MWEWSQKITIVLKCVGFMMTCQESPLSSNRLNRFSSDGPLPLFVQHHHDDHEVAEGNLQRV
jgi:hypothetical protein